MKNLAGLMKQASQMQAKMEELQTKLDALMIEGEAGAGLVKVTLNGKGDMKNLVIDPKLMTPADTEMVQDLILAAYSHARGKVEAASTEEMRRLTGGIDLPAGFKLPF